MTHAVASSARPTLEILMAAGVPKRREGGVATIVYNLGREMQQRGHRVTYIFLDDLVPPDSVSPRFSELIFSARLAKYITANRHKFSLLNLHAPAGLVYGLRRKWMGRWSGPPYVMTLHGLEERRVDVMTREAKKGRAWNFGWRNRAWHSLYHFPRFRWAIRTADGAHAYSRDVWNLLQLKYGLAPNRVAYIPNGVERRFFGLAGRRYSRGETLRLLYAGTWLDQRGIFYIREAMLQLVPRIAGLKLTIAGPGAPAEDVMRFFGPELAAHVEVRPVIAAGSMQELYAEHDLFVFPSLMEGLPSALLEAMASGMPVITAETCGMPDIVQDGFNGLLVPPADAGALERAIERLAESEGLRERLGCAAQGSMKRYDWPSAAEKLEELFLRVVGAEDASKRV
ncbi:MAG: glycosyltransferase family 4 protein [Acidobacteria bacterium]|nr:glycosyltransferase family 4 protein [Acidobacteriota bacterium]